MRVPFIVSVPLRLAFLAFPARAKKFEETVGVEASDRTQIDFVFALAPIYARTEGG